jgi:hypothetical protein
MGYSKHSVNNFEFFENLAHGLQLQRKREKEKAPDGSGAL